MCPHLGGVATHPWMVGRLQTLCTELVFNELNKVLSTCLQIVGMHQATEIEIEHEQSAENA